MVGQLATEGSFWCSLLNLAEIADGALRLAYRRDLLQFSVSCIRSEGKRRGRSPRKDTSSDRSAEENKTSDRESSGLSNQEEIIALFRRIQSSISKGGSASTKKRSSNSAKEKQSLDSVVNVLRQSPAGKDTKGNIDWPLCWKYSPLGCQQVEPAWLILVGLGLKLKLDSWANEPGSISAWLAHELS